MLLRPAMFSVNSTTPIWTPEVLESGTANPMSQSPSLSCTKAPPAKRNDGRWEGEWLVWSQEVTRARAREHAGYIKKLVILKTWDQPHRQMKRTGRIDPFNCRFVKRPHAVLLDKQVALKSTTFQVWTDILLLMLFTISVLIGSCIGVLFVSLLYEGLKLYRAKMMHRRTERR